MIGARDCYLCMSFQGGIVSSFCRIGKKTVFDVWRSIPSLVTLFGCLSETPEAITDDCMEDIEIKIRGISV